MVLLVRLRDPVGMHRLVFSDATATWAELQQQVEDVTKVKINEQKLSRKPLSTPQFVQAAPGDSLQKIGIANGDVLFLGGHTAATLAAHSAATGSAATGSATAAPATASSSSSASSSAASAAAAPAHQLTSRCNHGPRGACAHCAGVEPGMESKIKGKCNHGPNATCIHCSQTIKEQTKGE
jgi:hypothetical protein